MTKNMTAAERIAAARDARTHDKAILGRLAPWVPFYTVDLKGVSFARKTTLPRTGEGEPDSRPGAINRVTREQLERLVEALPHYAVRLRAGTWDKPQDAALMDLRSPHVTAQPGDRPLWIEDGNAENGISFGLLQADGLSATPATLAEVLALFAPAKPVEAKQLATSARK